MTDAVEHKRYWGLAEILMWIRSRDHERVAAMSDLSENDAMTLALFSYRARLDPRSLPRLRATSSNSDHEAAVLNENGKSSDPDVRSVMDPNRALNDRSRPSSWCKSGWSWRCPSVRPRLVEVVPDRRRSAAVSVRPYPRSACNGTAAATHHFVRATPHRLAG
jgi:hypothetical protein